MAVDAPTEAAELGLQRLDRGAVHGHLALAHAAPADFVESSQQLTDAFEVFHVGSRCAGRRDGRGL